MPCFNQVLLERIGLNSSAFPELAQQQNNKWHQFTESCT